MKWDEFKEAIDILDKYVDDDDFALHASHEKLQIGVDIGIEEELEDVVSEEDIEALDELGMYKDDEFRGCFYCFT